MAVSVPNTQKPRNPIAAYAFLDDVHGVALADHTGRVYFQADDPAARWQTLTNADMPRLTLLGFLDLIESQRIADERFGSLYKLVDYRCSEHSRTTRAA